MAELGRVALVTGGSRGIGAAICVALAKSGHRVAVNFHSREEAATTLVAAIERAGGTAIAIAGDVANADSVAHMVREVERALGPVTILVNNAALTDVHKPWQEIDEAEWDAVMAVNLKSCFLCFRAVYPAMRAAAWGRVVNISSVTFWLGRPHLIHYVASKAGMIGFTRSLAREVGKDGVTVNAVTPGAIRTEADLEMFPDQEDIARWLSEEQAVPRRGLPEDIAAAVDYLVSDRAEFITGQTLNVDGGWAMH
ncbi:MAG TPA: 3-oxoacyl-ACP reductase family protein [Thermomicrobiales bacterium]|nr:3-oxoacyl-ACP reductase family protein [Thermomicrobiales bacterium]